MTKTNYRPDIDGLRAIAVLAVILCHAFPALLPGGFSRLDIFFMISGYLISGILYKEVSTKREKGIFSFKEFYARHIRRLFPLLIVVLRSPWNASDGASVIDPLDYLTKDGVCLTEDEGNATHHNDAHLRGGFVAKKVNYLDETIAP